MYIVHVSIWRESKNKMYNKNEDWIVKTIIRNQAICLYMYINILHSYTWIYYIYTLQRMSNIKYKDITCSKTMWRQWKSRNTTSVELSTSYKNIIETEVNLYLKCSSHHEIRTSNLTSDFLHRICNLNISLKLVTLEVRSGRYRMLVGFTITYAFNAYHH